MTELSKMHEAKFRFVIRNQDPEATEADVRKRLREATENAVKEAAAATTEPAIASTELEGGFFGLGETAVILAIAHAVKVGAAAAGTGAATAAGKDFYDSFLKKQLRKLNLLPSKFKAIGSKPAVETWAKSKREPTSKWANKKGANEPVSKKAVAKKSGK